MYLLEVCVVNDSSKTTCLLCCVGCGDHLEVGSLKSFLKNPNFKGLIAMMHQLLPNSFVKIHPAVNEIFC